MRASYRLKPGQRPGGPGGSYDGRFTADYEYVKGSGDLDECNGRFGVTPEFPQGTYHYYLTEEFPYIGRLWRGTPDPSFFKRGPWPRPGPRGPRFRSDAIHHSGFGFLSDFGFRISDFGLRISDFFTRSSPPWAMRTVEVSRSTNKQTKKGSIT